MPHLGVAWYPEHWPAERWAEDVRLMRAAGVTVARLAEFAWSTLEPAPGQFAFDWLEQAIRLLADAGIDAVLGTPTAAPPAWLVQQAPDLLALEETGRRVQFGNRCHYCVNSPDMHAASARIAAAMAERFGRDPHVIGWQIDNEYNRVCYCPRCRRLFQEFLAARYGTLAALNAHWSTAYWSQTYDDWSQIPIPVGPHNPGLMLEFQHFVTDSYRRFQRLQIDALRPRLHAGAWITHNFMGWFGGFDHYALAADLDLASWDWYIGTGYHDYLNTGAIHDLTRGFKRKNFWLMETQPGNVNWSTINNSLNRGEARAMAWHAVAHGADAVSYWQWRSAYGGQEQLHGTLVDQSGQPRPFYAEAQQLGRELEAASKVLDGSTVPANVALLADYDSRWSIEWQRHHAEFDYVLHFRDYYRPLAARNAEIDVISADAPLDGYRLVVAPALLILTPERAERLEAFVRGGGHLVLTIRTGMKDAYNALLPRRQPGPLAAAAGAEVEDYYALLEPVPVAGDFFAGESRQWAERLKVLDPETRVLARYGEANGWLDGQAAVTAHAHGDGRVYLVGVYLDAAAQQALIDHILDGAGLHPLATPPGVELRRRVTPAGQDVHILINHTREPRVVPLPWAARDVLSGAQVRGEIELGAYGVACVITAP